MKIVDNLLANIHYVVGRLTKWVDVKSLAAHCVLGNFQMEVAIYYVKSYSKYNTRVSNPVFTETEKPGNPDFLKTEKPVFGCL